MEPNPVQQVSNEIDARVGATDVGMLTLRTANKTLQVASQRPDPEDLYNGLWYEGEVCCLFADSNVGKSIYAVQMADEIARLRNVLYVDCELSDKQFQLRYTDRETGMLHELPESLIRAEINPSKMDMKNFEEQIITDIETAAQKAATDTIMAPTPYRITVPSISTARLRLWTNSRNALADPSARHRKLPRGSPAAKLTPAIMIDCIRYTIRI